MRNIIRLSLMIICFWVSLTSFTSEESNFKVAFSQGDITLSVIANSKGAPSEISFSKLKSVFKGEQQRWKDGTKVTLALMKTTTPIGDEIAKRLLGMTSKELNKYFLALVFQGKMSSPQFFDSEEDLIKYVKSNEGAIGIVGSKNTGGLNPILVDGKKTF
jgi:hypothetical protein